VKRAALLSITTLVLMGCGSGESIITAGKEPPVATQPPSPTLAPGETLPVGETLPPAATTVAPTTTAVLLDTLPDCPTDALTAVTTPVELTMWLGLTGPLADQMRQLADAYNASQSKVHVSMVEASYQQTIRGLQSSQDNRPDSCRCRAHSRRWSTRFGGARRRCLKSVATQRLPADLADAAIQRERSMPLNISTPFCLQQEDVRCRAQIGEAAGSARRDMRADSDLGQLRAATPESRSTPTSIPVAVGTSSSGSPRPASSMPTIRTVARRAPPRCCTTTTPGSRC
jgi:hypothetical protein